MRDPKAQLAWRAQLRHAREEAVGASTLSALRRVASAYNTSMSSSTDLETARNRVLKALDDLLRAAGTRQTRRRSAAHAPKGSSGCPSPTCSNASSVQEQPPAHAAAAGTAAATASAADGQDAASQCTGVHMDVDSASESTTPAGISAMPCPTAPAASLPAPPQVPSGQAAVGSPAVVGAAAPPPAPRHAASGDSLSQPQAAAPERLRPTGQPSSAEALPPAEQPAGHSALPPRPAAVTQRATCGSPAPSPELAAAQQQIASLTSQLADVQQQLTTAQRQLSQLQRQLTSTHATGLQTAADLTAVQAQVHELTEASMQHASTRDSLSLLQSKQEQLQQRQQQDACASSVVLKCPEALPSEGAAAHAQQLLQQRLGVQVTVLRVQPLRSSGSSSSSKQRRHTYRVDLGSRGERTAVLRVKAQRLRGSAFSIDALLTPEQRSSKQQLQPVARQAKAAGRDVRWRYGQLLIDGTPYTGPGSVPDPVQPSTAAQASSQPTSAGGWQTVQHRKPPQPKPSYAQATRQQPAGSAKAQGSTRGRQQPPASQRSGTAGAGGSKQQRSAKARSGAKAAGNPSGSPQRQQQQGSRKAAGGGTAASSPPSPTARA
jgi:hypothetical protein